MNWPLCRCGCGEPVQAAPRTDRTKGWRKGEPTTCARGHANNGIPVRDRLLGKIVYVGDCWLWQGGCNEDGYGMIRIAGRTRLAHAAAYEMFVGPIPVGLELDHVCRKRACINPAHLEPVTHLENVARGEVGQPNARKTHCLRGHPLSGENLGRDRLGRRHCRTCRKANAARNYQERRKAELLAVENGRPLSSGVITSRASAAVTASPTITNGGS